MKYFTVFCLIIVFSGADSAEKWVCDKSGEKKVDNLMSKLLTFGSSRKYPTSKTELKGYCAEQYRLLSKVEDYKSQCLDTLSKQSVGVILFSIKNLVNQYCKKNTKYVEDIFKAAPCANKATKEFNKCHINYIDALMSAEKTPDPSAKVPLLCCEYHRIFECLHTRGKNVEGCNDKVLDTAEDFVKAHFDNVLNLLCGDYKEDSDKCKSVPKIKRKVRKGQRRPKTFILPLISVLKGLPEL